MKVMVLAGGPDREREVSLHSGECVAAALREAGHEVLLHDLTPADTSALDAFAQWQGDCIFPALHGRWGEGGGAQTLLEARGFSYVGCTPLVAELCMDKHRTKLVVQDHEIATPQWELIGVGQSATLEPPVVVKAFDEGSSIDLFICHDVAARDHAVHELLNRHARLLVEQFIAGREMTVSVIGREPGHAGVVALPVIHIVPKPAFYDYQAKYLRDDTEYRFDIDAPPALLERIQAAAVCAHERLGVRHLSRSDFIVDAAGTPWFLEINTMPGFTTHSLLPKAARQSGLAMPQLVDRLVRLAVYHRRKS